MKKIYLIILLIIGCAFTNTVFAQSKKTIEVKGIVVDEKKAPLIGVNVTVKDSPGLGVITDMNGRFKIKVSAYSWLIFSYIGYEKEEVLIKEQQTVNVVMKESQATTLNEVVVTGMGAQKKVSVTGAVTTVDLKELKTPTASITNALAGVVPGVFARQTSGQPGDNISEFWIRGISTFGAGSSALVLVDGFERSMNEINVEDIETFSVLKDAAATAIYGSRGANGVVLITTKTGKAGKVKINGKVEYTYSQPTRLPDFVDGYTYASLVNEARTTRNQEPIYTGEELNLIKNGLDPDLYPNVDWMGMFLKGGAPTYRAVLNMEGGSNMVRYYVSTAYTDEGGIYKTDKTLKDYNTNSDYRLWNYRMNVDMNITKTTLLRAGVSGTLGKQNQPGGLYSEIWASLMGQNPVSMPVRYSNGYVASRTGGEYQNPWVLITQQGYTETWNNKLQTTVTLEQDFNFITKGLKFYGRFGYDTNSNNWIRRMKWPEGWQAERQRDSNGELVFHRTMTEQLMTQRSSSVSDRKEYFEWQLSYDRTFAQQHHVGAVVKYTQDKTITTSDVGDDIKAGVDRRHQGLAGQVTYGWKDRYFLTYNFGYNGSENFAKHHQYGFFPAYSVAWNIAEEPIVAKNLKWVNMFKLRYSYGKVGNDYMSMRFPYLSSFKSTDGFQYADIGSSYSFTGLTYSTLSSQNVTWEKSTKKDLGLDFTLFNSAVTGTIDYFHEQRDGIYMVREYLPPSIGLNSDNPSANVGSVLSKGFDGNIALQHKIGKVDITWRGNITYSKNKILEDDEQYSHYPYTQKAGFRVNQARGLVSLGLFKDYEDIRNSPTQKYGTVMPGDIKYKDINGDGIVDDNDIVAVGSTTKPNLVYGFGVSGSWEGFDLNLHFQGVGKSSFFIDGYTVYPFRSSDWGNILTDVVDSNRWILNKNEDTHAKYPRLSYGGNTNNYRSSSYWLRNGSYLRLKNIELGYTIPKPLAIKMHISSMRFYLMGTNVLTFSKFKLWDPELGSTNGQQYPLSKTYTVGMTINL